MTTSTAFALLGNGSSLPWADVPEWPVEEFARRTAAEIERGARLCAWFGVPEDGGTRLVAVVAFDADNTLAAARSLPASGGYPSLTPAHPQAHLFEREVWEQHGVMPRGHPWLKPVRASAGSAPQARGILPRRTAERYTRLPSGRFTPGSSSPAISASNALARRCCTSK